MRKLLKIFLNLTYTYNYAMHESPVLIGPFTQLLTMRGIPLGGPVKDSLLDVIHKAGIIVEDGKIRDIGKYQALLETWDVKQGILEEIEESLVIIPGLVDPHTHICWAGSRHHDFSMRLEGMSYLDIAKTGGGIWSTVLHTREASLDDLVNNTRSRADELLKNGTTTVEVKSGYGLNLESELKILEAIYNANKLVAPDLVSTCLAAHILPNDYNGSAEEYLSEIIEKLLPQILRQKLSNRVDIYIDDNAFTPEQAKPYLTKASALGFDIVVHADQFKAGGSHIAVEMGALSVDHLEVSTDREIQLLADSNTIPVALPGASIGLGEPFTPARKLLDAGASLAIGSDWNPGSAPMGDLLVQASILAVYEKLTIAETLAAITFRAADALKLSDRGVLDKGKLADFIAFPLHEYQEIFYNQGRIKPSKVWKEGELVYSKL
jgi:imidazolonepropionase